MRAVRMHRHGGPEVLVEEECPRPRISADEVFVRVRACALNHLDLWVRRGLPGVEIPMPHILGSDIAGVVEDVGGAVEGLSPGDEVVLAPGVSCGRCRYCLGGSDNLCRSYTLFGYLRAGGYAEYLASPAANVIAKPASLSFAEAAAFPLTMLTSWHMLVTRAALRPGEVLLVLGAGSGVGSAAIQIGKLLRAEVIATAGSKEKLAKAAELGADHLIDHSSEDIASRAREITEGRGVDVVFEHVGTATWEKSMASLARNGRLVTCGATTGYQAQLDLRHLFARHLTVLGSYMGGKGEMLEVTKLVAKGLLRPVVDRILPLSQARQAHEIIESRKHFGKVVLAVD